MTNASQSEFISPFHRQSDSVVPPPAKPNPPQPTIPHLLPTSRLYLILGLGFLIPLGLAWIPGDGIELGWAAMLLFDMVVLIVTWVDYQRSQWWDIQVTRHCDPRLSIGRDNPIHLTVTVGSGPGKARQAQLHLRDSYPQDFQADQDRLILQIAPHTETDVTYHVFPPQRGAFQWQGVTLRLLSPQGFAWKAWQIPIETEVDVYPDLMGLRLLSVRLSLEAAGGLRRRQRTLGGTEFAELQEYNRGDDLRLIDWKATARRGHPLVRVCEPERDQPLLILLDRGRLMTAQVAGLKRFDWALNATLSLAMAGLRRGDRVGVCVFDNDIHTWIPPQSGNSYLSRILEQVYNLEPVMTESDYVAVASRVLSQYTRRALVVLLTDIVDAIASSELLAAMARLSPRFLPFCVALRDPLVDSQAHQALALTEAAKDLQIQQLYEQAVALDLLHQRSVAFAQLQQQGVLVLDAPAPSISEQLVERYLLLKARNRL
ncbi:DUF58 domain-containing protein [Acaryochloris sp. CCMEE 5410]|uniref:DUF58 domain-containing protein n=1 Tax=Acaryochloris sp. CCMEE 5410 TaxID=310037 RepID=UPI0002484024|nr:DUF58 domain-containing protein [Acaryochloris sp. CCMEE 5410]KAI9134123.1 DUF58 domain-containing protein [Acaryochloris sp. CCMEE 5410]